MLAIALPLFVILAIASDIYIIRRYILTSHMPTWSKRLLVIYSIALHSLFIVALTMYSHAINAIPGGYMRAMIWIIWFYLLNTAPNFIFTIFSLLGSLNRRISMAMRLTGIVVGLAIALTMIYGATIGRNSIEIRPVDVTYDSLPEAARGMRIAMISDIHLGNINNLNHRLELLRDLINEQQVDMVVFGGDLVNIKVDELTPEAMNILGGIRSRLGTFSVLGNHDLGKYVRDTLRFPPSQCLAELIDRQQRMGWQILVDSSVVIAPGVSVTGVDFPRDKSLTSHDLPQDIDFSHAYDSLPKGGFNITISHTPLLWDHATGYGRGDLVLSGHTHAMQMKFTIFGRSYSPASMIYDYWSGLHRKGRSHLYINDGFGYVAYPMRIGTRPEVTIITLCDNR